jgi:hypothetical protein
VRLRPATTTVCPTCGGSTAAAQPHCHRCGADLSAPETWRDATSDALPLATPTARPGPGRGTGTGARPAPPRRRWRGTALILAGSALLAAGIGAGYRAGLAAGDRAAASPTDAPGAAGPSTAETTGTTGATGTALPTGGPSRSGIVEVAPALVGRPETAAVVGVLTAYFTAINRRDYPAYRATVVMRPSVPQSEPDFRRRFRSTRDDDVRLLGLRPGDGGSWVASVGFTSRQDPADAPDRTSACLRWSIAFPLVPAGDGFLIDAAGLSTTVRRPC